MQIDKKGHDEGTRFLVIRVRLTSGFDRIHRSEKHQANRRIVPDRGNESFAWIERILEVESSSLTRTFATGDSQVLRPRLNERARARARAAVRDGEEYSILTERSQAKEEDARCNGKTILGLCSGHWPVVMLYSPLLNIQRVCPLTGCVCKIAGLSFTVPSSRTCHEHQITTPDVYLSVYMEKCTASWNLVGAWKLTVLFLSRLQRQSRFTATVRATKAEEYTRPRERLASWILGKLALHTLVTRFGSISVFHSLRKYFYEYVAHVCNITPTIVAIIHAHKVRSV